ncbi:MAG TPA: hypothetical protein VEH29_12405 [Acidimicrobiales bacterium]|nr:hypothetical protein [Acidimicrobiales bacterium]
MDTSSNPAGRPRRLMIVGVLATAAIGGIVALPLRAGAQHAEHTQQAQKASARAKSTLMERKVGKYGEVLTASDGYSLYLLSTESKGKLHCTSTQCVTNWPPLVVAKHAKITAGPGVKGKVGHVTRGSQWQVTYNGWPVYLFIGDSGPGQSNGEKIVADGGTWYLVHAAAKTNSATPVKNVTSGGSGTTTTTTWG